MSGLSTFFLETPGPPWPHLGCRRVLCKFVENLRLAADGRHGAGGVGGCFRPGIAACPTHVLLFDLSQAAL